MTVTVVPFVAPTWQDDVRFELDQLKAERARACFPPLNDPLSPVARARETARVTAALDRHVCRLERLLAVGDE